MARTKSVPKPEDQLQRLRSYGVEARSEGFRWQVQKGPCVAVLEPGPDGLKVAGHTGYQIGSEIGELLDGGYQKFLKTPTRKVPATAEHLQQMHAFQEALSAALGATSLYNQALGTVSTSYHYDRVKGRANP